MNSFGSLTSLSFMDKIANTQIPRSYRSKNHLKNGGNWVFEMDFDQVV